MQKKNLLTAFIISFSDGLVLPMVLLTALMALGLSNSVIFKITLAFILFYALVMMISNYFTHRSHKNTFIKTETFENIGLSKELEAQLLQDHQSEKEEWDDVMKENEDSNNNTFTEQAFVFLGYALSGTILILPFLFFNINFAFVLSCGTCLLAILVFGILKAKLTNNAPARLILRSLFNVSVLSALVYFVIHFLKLK